MWWFGWTWDHETKAFGCWHSPTASEILGPVIWRSRCQSRTAKEIVQSRNSRLDLNSTTLTNEGKARKKKWRKMYSLIIALTNHQLKRAKVPPKDLSGVVSYFNSLPKYLNYEICASWKESHFNYIAQIRIYSRIFARANVLILLLIGWECGPRFFSRSCTVNKTKEMNFTWLATPTSSLPKRKILGHLFLPRCLKQRSRCFLSPSLLFLSFSVSCLPASPFLFRTLIPISKNSPLVFSLHIERFVLPSQKVKLSTWNKSETL